MSIQSLAWGFVCWFVVCLFIYHKLYGNSMSNEDKFFNAMAHSIIIPITSVMIFSLGVFMFHALCGYLG